MSSEIEVPEGWRSTTLGKIANESKLRWDPADGTHHVYVALEHIGQGTGRLEGVGRSDGVESAKTIFRPGDILFGKLRPNLKKTVHVDFPGICSTDIVAIRATKASSEYLFHLLSWDRTFDFAVKTASGTKMPRTSWPLLSEYEFNLPPLPEQRRIAEILTSVDEAIAATEALIEQTKRVKQGVLRQLLTRGIGHTRFKQTEIGEIPEGWNLTALRDLSERITSGSRGWAQYYSTGGDLFIRSQNVRDCFLDLSDRQYVQVPSNGEGVRTLIAPRDLLFTITGNGVGNVALVPEDLANGYVSQHIGLVRLRDTSHAQLIATFFSPSGPGNEQLGQSQYGQSKPGLSLENLRDLLVPTPPSSELAVINGILANFEDIILSRAAEFAQLQSLKSALMSDLLTGRKRVTLPSESAAA